LFDWLLDKLHAALREQFMKLAAVLDFENPSGFFANTIVVIVNLVVLVDRSSELQHDAEIFYPVWSDDEPSEPGAERSLLHFFKAENARVPT
jgi:hypothetical protein